MKRTLTVSVLAVALVTVMISLALFSCAGGDAGTDLAPTAFTDLPTVRTDQAPTSIALPTPAPEPGETGGVRGLWHNAGEYPGGIVPRFALFELGFDLTADYPHKYYFYDPDDTPERDPGRESPYGVDGVSVDAHFISPTDTELTLPAFWYEEQTRRIEGGVEVVEPTGESWWAARFAPGEMGPYRFYITVQDKHGQTRYPESGYLDLTVGPSDSPGFIRANPNDPRWFQYDNGGPYLPLAADSLQFWGGGTEGSALRATWYEQELGRLGTSGMNLVRIWTECDGGYGLVFESRYTAGTPADPAAATKGTHVNQTSAWRIDRVLEAAQANGVAVQFCSHGDVYWQWDASIRNESWNPHPVAWDDWRHLNYWKRNFRLRVARFGWSTAILAWDTWNEHGHILPGMDVFTFYQIYSVYQRETDPYHHLITTGQGSQTWTPDFWGSGAVDIATYHDYMMCRRYPNLCYDTAEFIHKFGQCLRSESLDWSNGQGCGLGIRRDTQGVGSRLPIVWSEFGIGMDQWNQGPLLEATVGEGGTRATHNRLWAGLFSPLGTSAVEWYSNAQDEPVHTAKRQTTLIATAFLNEFSYEGARFACTADVAVDNYVGPIIETDGARVLAILLPAGEGVYAWLQNPGHTWANAPTLPTPMSGQFTVPGLDPGTYRVEWWDTREGTTSDGGTVTVAADMNLTLQYQELVRDAAVKIIRLADRLP